MVAQYGSQLGLAEGYGLKRHGGHFNISPRRILFNQSKANGGPNPQLKPMHQ